MTALSLSDVSQLFATPPAPPIPPSAGIIERQIEKEYEAEPFPANELPDIEIDIPEEQLNLPQGEKVYISTVSVSGNGVLSEDQIEACLSSCLQQDLCMQDINQICRRIEKCYAKRGYFLARAYPPEQTIEQGVLTINVLEGMLGEIYVEGNKYYSTRYIGGFFQSLRHRPLRYDQFLYALMVLNDNHDLAASAIFKKGDAFGTADVVLKIKDARPLHLYLNGNNYGRYLTANARIGGRFDAGNLLTYGDMLSIAEVLGCPIKSLYFTDLVYSFPLNKKGLIVEFAYLFSRFHVNEFTALDLAGHTDIATVKLTQPYCRRRSCSADFFAYFDYKQIQNFTLSHKTSFDKLRNINLGTAINFYTPSQGRNFLNIQTTVGIPRIIGGMDAISSHSSRIGGGAWFFKANCDYDLLQKFSRGGNAYFYLHASSQWSPNRLVSAEQFYLGGVDTVRGFPFASFTGDSGYYMNTELRMPLLFFFKPKAANGKKNGNEIFQLIAFVDQGAVKYNKGTGDFLCSGGFGVRMNGPWKLTAAFDIGFPFNHRSQTRDTFWYFRLAGQVF